MNSPHPYLEVSCRSCGYRRVLGPVQMLEQLRHDGLLKRAKEPARDVIQELFVSRLDRLPCPTCGVSGLQWGPAEEWNDADWDDAVPVAGRACEVCRRPISPERLEVFPDTRRCRDCQQSADRGEDSAEPEYCPRCGAIMQLRLQRGAGIARYEMYCSDCRR